MPKDQLLKNISRLVHERYIKAAKALMRGDIINFRYHLFLAADMAEKESLMAQRLSKYAQP